MAKRKHTLYAKTGVTFGGKFIPAKSTIEVSEDLFKDLQETRFFRHGILIDMTKEIKEEDEEIKQDEK